MTDDHITDEHALAFVDGALAEGEWTRTDRHVRQCRACAARIQDVRALDAAFTAAVDLVDAHEPRRWRREEPRRVVATAGRFGAKSARVSLVHFRWAAVALLCVAGIASAALWRTANSKRARATITPVPVAARSANRTGVVIPTGDSVIVIIDGAGVGSLVKFVRDSQRENGSHVEVTGASSPVFRSDGGMLTLSLDGRVAEVRVAVPAQLRVARVDVNGRSIVRLDGDRVEPTAAGERGIRVTW